MASSKKAISNSMSDFPSDWFCMNEVDYGRYCIFENDFYKDVQGNAPWTLRPALHIYKALNIIHVALQTTFTRQILFKEHGKYLMFKKTIDFPTGEKSSVLESDNKREKASSSKRFSLMEERKLESKSNYYKIIDSEEEEEIERLNYMKSENDKNNEERIIARSMAYKIVEESEDINIKILSIDKLQNKKKYLLHKAWADIMEIPFDNYVTAYHGTSVSVLEDGIVKFGLCGKEGVRGLFGTGIYLAKYFDTAKEFAREKRNNNEEMIVLVVRCLLGKIKTVDQSLGNFTDFIDIHGDVCNTKYIPSMNYWIVSDDASILCEYSCRFQIIDDIKVFPSKKQLEMDKKRKREYDEYQANLAQDKIDAKAKADKEKSDKDADDAKKKSDMKEARKKRYVNSAAKNKMNLYTDEEKTEMFEKKKARLIQKQKPIPSKRIDLNYFHDIDKDEHVILNNLNNPDKFLENKTGHVKLIVEERNKKIVFMVKMDDDKFLDLISHNNKIREVNNKGTGYSRYGPLMDESYFICQRKHMQKMDQAISPHCDSHEESASNSD